MNVASLALEFKNELEQASSVLIGTHLNPDGDALGSALAVSLVLDGMRVDNEVVCHHGPPDNLQFLPGVARLKQTPSRNDHDLFVAVDLDSLERLGSAMPHFASANKLILVDHHVPHEAPGDLRIVDTSAPATAAILGELFLAAEIPITPEIATCLLTGIVTDTGSFRFRNTTAGALVLAAKLLELGGDINRVSEEVFQSRKLASMRLLGYLLEGMVLECDNRLAYGMLSTREFEASAATDEDTEGFPNELLAVNTVQIAAVAREFRPGRVRVSLRCRDPYDVAAVAREFGGGGHKNAAGCSFEGVPLDAMTQLLPKLREALNGKA